MKTIGVIGFGKIGQAIAANMIRNGFRVAAVDRDAALQESFERSTYFTREPGVGELLSAAYAKGQLTVSADYSGLDGSEAMVIGIPLLVDENKTTIDAPFLHCLKQLLPYCNEKLPVIVETSVPVGYCRRVLLPVLEAGGKEHGKDFLLAHSPERIKSGTMLDQLDHIPKIIGGITNEATERTYALYLQLFKKEQLHCMESIEAAEMLKLAGMIYRDLNIALSNQLAMFAQASGIDFPALLPLINTDGEAHLLQPGIGVGGHCTPVYPYFLIDNFSKAGLDFTLAKTGRNINDSMVSYAVSLVAGKLASKKALVLGLAFRPGVKEDANSTGAQLYHLLRDQGFEVSLHDAAYTKEELQQKGFSFAEPENTKAEVVFLVTMHKEYEQLDFVKMAANGVRYFLDGRNAFSKEHIEAAGIAYFGIGR